MFTRCCGAAGRRRPCGDALKREAPAGHGEVEEVGGAAEGGGDEDGSLAGRGGEEVGAGRHLALLCVGPAADVFASASQNLFPAHHGHVADRIAHEYNSCYYMKSHGGWIGGRGRRSTRRDDGCC